jgi:23S rRNA pseudouridine1911/1915/1917 synthase
MAPSVPPSPATGQTLLEWLARRYPTAKRQTLRRMLQAGRVTVGGKIVRNAKQPIDGTEAVSVAESGAEQKPAKAAFRPHRELRVVYEDDDVLVVDKPVGLLTSTVPRVPRPTLLARVRDYVEAGAATRGPSRGRPPRVGLIHRLDRDASGLLVFSKTHEAYLSLKRQFFEHSVERVYVAVVKGTPTPRRGRIQSRLVERADGTVYSTDQPGQGERAVTDYEVVESRAGRAMVRVTLQTGRKHQIRVHLSERGTPIAGDTMYGPAARPTGGKGVAGKRRGTGANEVTADGLMLVAVKLSFTHPRTGERVTVERPLPESIRAAFPAGASGSR